MVEAIIAETIGGLVVAVICGIAKAIWRSMR